MLARMCCRQRLRLAAAEPVAYLALAGFYSDYERLDGAVELLESAETRFPNDTSILFQLGAVLEQSDRHADAERSFRRVLDRDPQHAATLNYLGYMLADRGDRLDESVSLPRARDQDRPAQWCVSRQPRMGVLQA